MEQRIGIEFEPDFRESVNTDNLKQAEDKAPYSVRAALARLGETTRNPESSLSKEDIATDMAIVEVLDQIRGLFKERFVETNFQNIVDAVMRRINRGESKLDSKILVNDPNMAERIEELTSRAIRMAK